MIKMEEEDKPLPEDIKKYLDNIVVDGLCEGIICTNEPKIDSILSNQDEYKKNIDEIKDLVSSLREDLEIKKQVNGVKEEETWRIRENLYDGQWKIWKKIKKIEENRIQGDEILRDELIKGREDFAKLMSTMEANIRKDMPSKTQMWAILLFFGIIAGAIVTELIKNILFN